MIEPAVGRELKPTQSSHLLLSLNRLMEEISDADMLYHIRNLFGGN